MATVRKGYERRQSTGDILLPIPADVAPLEQSSTASQAHTKGSLFYYNNSLYKATSNIAAGGTISPGSNCTATTIGDELLNSGSSYIIETYTIATNAAAGSHTFSSMSTIIAAVGANTVSSTQSYGICSFPGVTTSGVTVTGNSISWTKYTSARQLVIIGV